MMLLISFACISTLALVILCCYLGKTHYQRIAASALIVMFMTIALITSGAASRYYIQHLSKQSESALQLYLEQQVQSGDMQYAVNLAHIYHNQNNYLDLAKLYKGLLRKNPGDIALRSHLLQAVYLASGRIVPMMIEMAEDILLHNPRDENALHILALENYRIKRYDRAIELWHRMLEMAQTDEQRVMIEEAISQVERERQ